MPFEPYRKPSRRVPQKSRSGATASLATMGPGETAAILVITIKGDAAEALGLTPDEAAPLAVLIGSSEDHGMVRVRRDDDNPSITVACRRRSEARFWPMFLGHLPQFVDRLEARQDCQWEMLDDGWLEVVLPAWADETRPKPTARIDGMPPQARAAINDKARQEAEWKEAAERRRQREGGLP